MMSRAGYFQRNTNGRNDTKVTGESRQNCVKYMEQSLSRKKGDRRSRVPEDAVNNIMAYFCLHPNMEKCLYLSPDE